MSTHQLQLRAIDDLRTEHFFVPAYQRGYRWTQQQVTELLQDVWEFVHARAKGKGQFYCLQPIVVAPGKDGAWEVVDGQQRLTTIYLILHHFNARFQTEYRKALYSIEYETRPASAGFLRDLDVKRAGENIDFFHMSKAHSAIQSWFTDKSNKVNDIESAFLNDVKIIWYEIDNASLMEVFQRLNIGKIPLTDAELVKALFLRSSNFEGEGLRALQLRQLQIAHEWDAMERRLQERSFWYFLTNVEKEANRIEFVLTLCADSMKLGRAALSDSSIFHTFSHRLDETGARAWSEWDSVKRLFQTMEEWFRDEPLYHLVGFLASQDAAEPHRAIATVSRLEAAAQSKKAFRRKLKAEIFLRVFRRNREAAAANGPDLHEFIRSELSNLDYASDKVQIRNALLLFNLASLMESESHVRFPFSAYKQERWDIEHIRSVQSRMPERPDDQKRWLSNVLEHLGVEQAEEDNSEDNEAESRSRRSMIKKTKELLAADKSDNEAFAKLFIRIQKRYDPHQDIEVDNSIGNLTLLDLRTNRGYGNAIFPLKRRTIIALDRVGRFVPLCTKNVFLKYYSKRVGRMLVWAKEDGEAYAAAISSCLARFFDDGAEA